jgi:hypothetical protein
MNVAAKKAQKPLITEDAPAIDSAVSVPPLSEEAREAGIQKVEKEASLNDEQLQAAIAALQEKGISLDALRDKLAVKGMLKVKLDGPAIASLQGKPLREVCDALALFEGKAKTDSRYKALARQTRMLIWKRQYSL